MCVYIYIYICLYFVCVYINTCLYTPYIDSLALKNCLENCSPSPRSTRLAIALRPVGRLKPWGAMGRGDTPQKFDDSLIRLNERTMVVNSPLIRPYFLGGSP